MRTNPAPTRTPARPGLPPFPPPPAPRPRRLSAWAALASLAALGACGGTLRVVRLTPASGELALLGNRDEAHAQAESYMRRQCPYGYEVISQGEVHPSTDPWSSPGLGIARADGSDAAAPSEWRIQYRCQGQVGEAPAPPAPPAAPAPKAPAVAPAAPPPPAAPAPAEPSAPTPAPSASNWF